jgi:hypothetical protein
LEVGIEVKEKYQKYLGPRAAPKGMLSACVLVLAFPWLLIALGCSLDIATVSGVGAGLILPAAVAVAFLRRKLPADPMFNTPSLARGLVSVSAVIQGILGFLFYSFVMLRVLD